MSAPSERILIVDFGSQVTQLIARRIRETGVYCEIVPYNKAGDIFESFAPKAVVLSGGPASVTHADTPRAPQKIFEAGIPVLGICYGQQAMCAQLGGKVESSDYREFGRAFVDVKEPCALFEGVWQVGGREQVWMSHGDRVTELPPGFRVVGASESAPFAIIADDARRFYGVMFHPEVVHTPHGADLLRNFVHTVAGCGGDWNMAAFRDQEIAKIREQVGDGRVICGLSGGVDSAVTAVLVHEAIGDQLTCVFVDTGMLRSEEGEQVVGLFRDHFNIPLVHSKAADTFLGKLKGVDDPEKKRKIIGATFIDVFEAEANKIGGADFLAQGTLYPDVIESVSFDGGPSVTIKSHHNVGGLPERMNMRLVEPLRELFKDEVRVLGPRAWAAGGVRRAASIPGAGPGDPGAGRDHRGKAGDPAQGGRDLPGGDPQRRAVRRDLAGLRRAAAGPHRRRDGRRPHLRPCLRAARRDLDRRHDRRLLPLRPRVPRPHRDPDHQRGEGDQPGGLRRDQQTAGHDRVGVGRPTVDYLPAARSQGLNSFTGKR